MPNDSCPPLGGVSPSAGGLCPDQSGSALLATVFVLLVVSLLGTTVMSMGQTDLALSSNYRSSINALNLADSGLQASAADLRADYYADPTDNWLLDWVNTATSPPTITTPFPDATGTIVNGLTLSAATLSPNPYPGTPYDLGGGQALGNGTFTRTIWLPPTITMENGAPVVNIRVRSAGADGSTATPATTTLDGVVKIDLIDSSPYSTGAFFGRGENGDVIRGGPVRIAGAVVVIGNLGTGRRGGSRSTRLDLSNGSSVVNNYAGIDDPTSGMGTLADKIPALDSIDFNGDTIDTLNAALHLKDATASTGLAGQLGEPDSAGDGYKETLDAVYSDVPVSSRTGNVYADTIAASDLPSDLTFPGLSAPYTDLNTGAQYPSFADFLNSNSYAPITGGDVVIDDSTPSFSYVDPMGKGSLIWDADTDTLTIDGIVKINGELQIGGGGGGGRGGGRGRGGGGGDGSALTTVLYEGTGVIWSTDDININADLYPVGHYVEDGPDADSLVDGNLGLIASDEIRIDSAGGNSNVQIMATLFAENRINVRTRANIVGSVVTNALQANRRGGVNIWHVPSLGAASPNGMPVGMMFTDIEVAIEEWFQRR